mmetsp:Transcript_2947/g.387  ORF Transcript_2947/g.387 Transcript_2947/m.387 type:complete len:80 (+) Transcript_2947:106-345(+)
MIQFIRAFISQGNELSVDERNILSVGYKNCVGNRRSAWRILSSIEKKEERRGNSDQQQRAVTYKAQIEEELKRYCHEIC